MARIVVLGSQEPLPAAFGLLTHTVRTLDGDDPSSMSFEDDVVVVDARTDLAGARDLCLRLQAMAEAIPVLLLAEAQALPVVTNDWGIGDFVLEGAQPGEVDARVRLLLDGSDQTTSIVCGPVVIDEKAYTATVGGQPLELTYTEFELLKFLALHPGRVLTREHLLSEVWGYDYYGGTRTVDVHIRRLRAKLGPEYDGHITTVRNVGYRFSATR